MILGFIFICFALFLIGHAAACNARMDTVKDHWGTSIYFKNPKYDDQWFDPRVSWSNKNPSNYSELVSLASKYLPHIAFFYLTEIRKRSFDPFSDFWHFEKYKMLTSLILAGVFTFGAGLVFGGDLTALLAAYLVVYYLGAGVAWNETFNLYYNRILLQAPYKKKWLWIK